jgi:WD40 repeat protein
MKSTTANKSVNFEKATLLWSFTWDTDWVSAVSFIGDKHFAAGNNLGEIMLWELPNKPEPLVEITSEKSKPADKSERPLYSSPKPIRQMVGHSNIINRLLCAENRWLISASNDHTVKYWDIEAKPSGMAKHVLNARTIEDIKRNKNSGRKPPLPLEVEVQTQDASKIIQGKEWIVGLSMSQDETTLVTGDDAGQVAIYDRKTRAEKKRWQVKGWAFAVAISPDLKQALVSERYPLVFDSGRHTAVKLWDVATSTVQYDLSKEFKDMQIASAAYSNDGKILALGRGGEGEGKIFLIDPSMGKKLRELSPIHQYGVTDLCFHPDGKHLASTGRDTIVRIWNIAEGKMMKELGKPRGGQFKDWFHALSFSPDGTRIAVADMAGYIHIWEFNTEKS